MRLFFCHPLSHTSPHPIRSASMSLEAFSEKSGLLWMKIPYVFAKVPWLFVKIPTICNENKRSFLWKGRDFWKKAREKQWNAWENHREASIRRTYDVKRRRFPTWQINKGKLWDARVKGWLRQANLSSWILEEKVYNLYTLFAFRFTAQ